MRRAKHSVIEALEYRRLLDSQIDLAFLADNTGSADAAMTTFKSDAKNLLARIDAYVGTADKQYGVAAYRDFDGPGFADPFVFKIDSAMAAGLTPANAGIDKWAADGGGDYPESNLYALTHSSTDLLWRDGSIRFIVWMGDAPGHDPSGTKTGDIATLPSTTAALVKAEIHVLGISWRGGGLDETGQATALATATDGIYVSQDTSPNVMDAAYNKIIDLLNKLMIVGVKPDTYNLDGMPWLDVRPSKNDPGIGLKITAFTQPAHGTVTTNYDGTLRYIPTDGYSGKDTFTYDIIDHNGIAAKGGVVTVNVNVPVVQSVVINGTAADNKITVNATGDTIIATVDRTIYKFSRTGATKIAINGLDGNDTITISDTVSVPCVIYGGGGNDSIVGSRNNDTIYGDAGNDTIYGGAGNDAVYGGMGNNLIYGGDGNDSLAGGMGSDTVYGDAGNDNILGGDGADVLYGGDGSDLIHGNGGNDTVFGGNGNDTLFGDTGNNVLYGDADNDYIDASGKSSMDTVFGGAGTDTCVADATDMVLTVERRLLPPVSLLI